MIARIYSRIESWAERNADRNGELMLAAVILFFLHRLFGGLLQNGPVYLVATIMTLALWLTLAPTLLRALKRENAHVSAASEAVDWIAALIKLWGVVCLVIVWIALLLLGVVTVVGYPFRLFEILSELGIISYPGWHRILSIVVLLPLAAYLARVIYRFWHKLDWEQ